MSTDAWIEEHWIGEAVLPRPRRAPKLPALSVPHAPTCSRGNAALAAHAQSRDSARHPGDGLSARQDGQNVVDQQARKLTQPFETAGSPVDLADCDPQQPLGRSRAGDGVRRDSVEDDRGGVGISEAIIQLFGLDAPIERRHDNAGELTCPVEARHFEPVLQDESETVAAPEAELGQLACEARDLLVPGRIAEPPLAISDGGRVWAALNRSEEGPAQIKHRKSITRRPRAEASGRFRFSAAPGRR